MSKASPNEKQAQNIFQRIAAQDLRETERDAQNVIYLIERDEWPPRSCLDEHRFVVTFFPTQSAQSKMQRQMTLEELCDEIQKTTASSKAALPWVKLSIFGKERTEKNCLRHNANVLSITGAEMDYDGGKITLDEAVAIAEEAGLRALLYTSASYTDEKPKWRILLPTSKPWAPSEREKLAARVNGVYGGVFDAASFTLSQSYYFGSVNDNPAHRAVVTAGEFIDLRDDLDAGAIYKTKGNGSAAESPSNFFQQAGEQQYPKPPPEKVRAALDVIGDPGPYADWVAIGHEIKSWDAGEVGWEIYDRWVEARVSARRQSKQCASPYNPKVSRHRWDGFDSKKTNIGALFNRATALSEGWWERAREEAKKAEVPTIKYITAPELEREPIEQAKFLVPGLILANSLNGLFGDGGVGKDLLLEQLSHAMTCGKQFLRMDVAQGRVLYFNVEDPVRELRWRQSKIMEHFGIEKTSADLRIAPMLGEDSLLGVLDRSGVVVPTPHYTSLCNLIEEFKPMLVIVGNRVNIFAVNQNDDAQAVQCLKLLSRITVIYNTTVIMPAHPSRGQLQSGEGSSGSVQWSNGCRHRLFMSRPKKGEEGEKPDRDVRVLEVMKSNWGPMGEGTNLRWENWVFKTEDEFFNIKVEKGKVKETPEQTMRREEEEAEAEFLRMLRMSVTMSQHVSPQPTANSYAPTIFSKHPGCKYHGKAGKKILVGAMGRLFAKNVLTPKPYGPPSDHTFMVVEK
jgi:RecA-family ATPase